MNKVYTIQEIAETIGLNKSTLYYYERIGLMLPISRKSNGHRQYTEKDIEWLQFVKRMRETGMPLSAIRAYAELHVQGGGPEDRLAILEQHYARMLAQQEALSQAIDFIEKKIDRFNKSITWKRES
ncbi:MAG: MerR family transcriptional regulator [Chloroflexota bacterium]